MEKIKIIGIPLYRTEMRNISGGNTENPWNPGFEAPCGESSCTSDTDCTGGCNAPGIKQYCQSIACQSNGSSFPNSTYKRCGC